MPSNNNKISNAFYALILVFIAHIGVMTHAQAATLVSGAVTTNTSWTLAQTSGSGDVSLPTGFTNPVTVTFVTSGVTVGSSIKLTVTPAQGTAYTATSAPTTGTTASATASVSVSLLSGPNTLQASVTYTVVASLGDAMSVYAQGERVEKVTLASTLGSKDSTVTLTTISGKEYVVPASVLATAQSLAINTRKESWV